MKKNLFVLLSVTVLIFLCADISPACTTILVTKGASADGSVIVSHSEDDELGDQRIVYVPRRICGTSINK